MPRPSRPPWGTTRNGMPVALTKCSERGRRRPPSRPSRQGARDGPSGAAPTSRCRAAGLVDRRLHRLLADDLAVAEVAVEHGDDLGLAHHLGVLVGHDRAVATCPTYCGTRITPWNRGRRDWRRPAARDLLGLCCRRARGLEDGCRELPQSVRRDLAPPFPDEGGGRVLEALADVLAVADAAGPDPRPTSRWKSPGVEVPDDEARMVRRRRRCGAAAAACDPAGRQLGGVVPGDQAAHRHARELVEQRQHRLEHRPPTFSQ